MLLQTKGFYLLTTSEGRWGEYSEDVFSSWNSHLMLKNLKCHPLGNHYMRLQFLGDSRVAFNPIGFTLPKADRNYGVSYCEACGKIYVKHVNNQRFCNSSCRINFYQKTELSERKRSIYERYNYRCASGERCKDYGSLKKLKVWWSGDRRPYCASCFSKNILYTEKGTVNESRL